MNTFIASDETVSSTHLRKCDITLQANAFNLATRYSLLLTYDYDVTMQMNAFIASDELVSATRNPDEHVYH